MKHSKGSFLVRFTPNYMRVQTIGLLFCLFALASSSLFSQACCSGGVPISSNLGLGAKDRGTLQLQLTYDYNTLRDLLAGSEKLDDQSRTRNTHSSLLEVGFDISNAFSVSTLISWVRQDRIIQTLSGGEEITINQGVGDAIVLFRYSFFTQNKQLPFSLSVGAGPKIPIGRADHRDNRGIILPADLQPGTGAWDGVGWGFFVYQPKQVPNLTFTTNSTLRLTTANQRFNGRQAYRFGNEFQLQSGLSYRLLFKNLLVDPLLIIQYRTVGPDHIDGLKLDNTGGHWLHARMGLNVNLSPNTSVRMIADLPIYRNLVGTQLSTSYRAAISLYHQLNLRKKSTNAVESLMEGLK